MATDRHKYVKLLTICCCLSICNTLGAAVTIQQQQIQQAKQDDAKQEASTGFESARVLNPRMDYNNEWRPVGRGDPLKKDPTYDYSPPALERVRYWAADSSDKENQTSEAATKRTSAAAASATSTTTTTTATMGGNKHEILMLGMANGSHERAQRPATAAAAPASNVMLNAKGELPLLQPKYSSIRRSYYAHQLPTHLMPPPPMQAIAAPNNAMQMMLMKPAVAAASGEYRHGGSGSYAATASGFSSSMASQQQHHHMQQQQQQQHPQQQSLQQSPQHSQQQSPQYLTQHLQQQSPQYSAQHSAQHSVQHSPQHSPQHSQPHQPYHSQQTHPSIPYYSTAATSPWTHTNSAPATANNMLHVSNHVTHASHISPYDAHQQESVNYHTYTRPTYTSHATQESYSPNAIRPSEHGFKPSARKPWLHELLQKELIKSPPSARPTMPATKYLMGTTQPIYERPPHVGISTTYSPVTFVTTAAPTTTTTSIPIYITTSLPTSPPIPTVTTTLTTTTTRAPPTTSTVSPYGATRLLIPTTSNLAFRPTVAPMEMTTDSLFSHYNQPEKPLMGPMYLIIEGHSKVKTYGKNELDPHQPKIVPIIPNRDPIIRVANPNEKRGGVETFQVKHLHTKMTPSTTTTKRPTTTIKPTIAKSTLTKTTLIKTTSAQPTTTKPMLSQPTLNKSTTTTKPTIIKTTTSKPTMIKTTTSKPTMIKSTTNKPTMIKTTTYKSTTSKPTMTKPTTIKPTMSKPTTIKPTTIKPTTFKPTTFKPAMTKPTTSKPTMTKPTETKPNMIKTNSDQTMVKAALTSSAKPPTTSGFLPTIPTTKSSSTILTKVTETPGAQPPTGMQGLLSLLDNIFQEEPSATFGVQAAQAPFVQPLKLAQVESRIGTKGGTIFATDDDVDSEVKITEPPRGVRQIFDYDQLPDARLKQLMHDDDDGSYEDGDSVEDVWMKTAYGEDYEDAEGHPIKRIDKVMDYEEDSDELETEGNAHEKNDEKEDDEAEDEVDTKDMDLAELRKA